MNAIEDQTWIISCPRCGRWKTLDEVGGVRIGAASAGKRVLGVCRACRRLRWMRVEQAKHIPSDRLGLMVDATPTEP